ncbi:COX15/CtaA family protein [Halobacterium bonnevillei]|uniref:Heme A synthase n=1 Tax=Halobacterium bonnevillei TaxID=2692200 RepID=A0A6B0SGU2_9EURY|nr:COX15/CtaA family protein [Halobacterium bonnevillei]MXR20994.1 heme A synthase [Halobacterium bonnevillei]
MSRRSYQLAAVTTVLTFALILIGEFTAVSGSGATCGLRWPDCSGQLLPFGLQLHDFVEQFHRSVAMVVGFFILGTGAVAWRNFDERDVRIGGVLAVVLLPLQVILGGTTVTFSGLVPWGYMPITQAIHHLAALAIFGTLVYTALRMRELVGLGVGRVRSAAFAGLALLPIQLAFSRNTLFAVYGTRVQLLHHAFELLVFAAALAVFVWAQRRTSTRAARAGWVAAGLVTVQILIGTGVVQFSATVQIAYYVLVAATVALFVLAARASTGRQATPTAAD